MKTKQNYSPSIRILSLILSLLIAFYLIPTVVYAEVFDAEIENTSKIIEEESCEQSSIIYEVKELREENVKHFRLADGSYLAAQYDYPVHYQNEDGQYVDIDNRLSELGSDFATGNSRIKFVKKIGGNGNIFTLHENDTKITMGLIGAVNKTNGTLLSVGNSDDYINNFLGKLTNLENISSTIVYEDILDGVDIEYVLHSLNVKENIIVKERNDSYSYVFTLELNNLEASLAENGNVYITSDNGATQYVIPSPTVFDANGNYAPRSESGYTLIQTGNGKYELTVAVASSWMNAESRAFPVTIDPPVVASGGTVIDFNIDETSPNTNTNGEDDFYVSSTQRAYIKFDENYFADIPTGASITKAELSIMSYFSTNAGARVGVYEITTNWDETLTWNKTVSLSPEGAFSANGLDYIVTKSSAQRYGWNITELYKKWLSGGNNYGVGLRLVDEGVIDESARFKSYEYRPSIPDRIQYEPVIMVTYIYNDGIESYYPTATHSAGLGGAGSINLSTGKLTLAIPTLTTTDALFAFTPTLVYNSSLAGEQVTKYNTSSAYSESYMPNGFKLNIQETVVRKNYYDSDGYNNTYYILHDADGSTHRFYQTVSILPYYDDDGLRLSLTENSTENALTITDVDGNYKTYSYFGYESWYLTSITDKYGNSLKFTFNENYQPTSVVVTPNGLSDIVMLQLFYENGKLSKVYNSASKESVILTYSNGNLAFVQYCYGDEGNGDNGGTEYASASYTYDANGYITKIEDSQAEKSLEYEITDGKITKISEKAGTTLGQEVSYTYGEGYTDIRTTGNDEILNTADDIITRYVFDSLCRATSVYSMSSDGEEIYGATTGNYDNSAMNKNSIKSNAVFNGINPADVVTNESGSGELFATIEGDANLNRLDCVYRQTVVSNSNVATMTVSNSDKEYIISGFGYANSILSNENARFSIGVEVYYYQGVGVEDEVVEYHFDFADAESVWQFTSGKFKGNPSAADDETYKFIRRIDIVCSYYGQLDTNGVSATSQFKNITFAEMKENDGYDYFYDTSTGNLIAKMNSMYWETYTYGTSDLIANNGDDLDKYRLTSVENSYGEKYEYERSVDGENTVEEEEYHRNEQLISHTSYIYNKYGLLTNVNVLCVPDDNTTEQSASELEVIRTSYQYYTSSSLKSFGVLMSETSSDGVTIIYIVDGSTGRLKNTFDSTDGKGYNYYYDEAGRLESVRPSILINDNYVDQPENVNYTYNNEGYLSQITTDSTTYSMLYDSFGNASAVQIGDNTLATYEYYPNNGKIKKIIYGNGFSEEYKYNTLEMLSEIWYNYGEGESECVYTYEYNSDGKIKKINNLLHETSVCFTYDARGRLTSVFDANADGNSFGRGNSVIYDTENRIINQTFKLSTASSFSTLYDYSDSGNLATETLEYLSSNHKISYTYDNFNRLSTVVSDLGTFDYTKSYHYYTDLDKKTSTRISYYVSEVNGSSTTYIYDYDPRGNITGITKGSAETVYTYDDIGQLTQEQEGDVTYSYAYDNAGNITSIVCTKFNSNSDIRPGLYAIKPPLYFTTTTTLGYTDSEWGDLLTSYNGTAITYDEIGNPLSYYNGTAYTFTWDGRRLVGAVNGTKTMSFTYNDEGIRTSKTVNGVKHTYYLNGSLIMAERWGNVTIVYLYDATGSPIGMMYRTESYSEGSWDTFWYEKNLFGDIIAVYNESGSKIISYTYKTAWGKHSTLSYNLSSNEGAQYNPFRYRGYYYDTETGLYYVSSRYYDPEIGRFINADSQLNQKDGILGYNMFAYCHNNPIMYSDPTGHSITLACIIIGAVIGAVAGGCAGAYVSKKQTGKVNGWAVAAGAVGGGVVGGLVGWGVGAAITAVGAAATGSAATAAAPVVQQVAEKASTALQTYYPPNDGFSGAVQKITLEAGTLIQRTGDLVGRYIAPAGTPTQMLSLPYDKIGQPTTILQVQQSVEVLAGRVAPWFGQIGGGIQYQLGTPLDQLISEGIIKIFGG